MNQNLQKISTFIKQASHLSAEVNGTTAILLEETIKELAQNRKTVKAQNRELEIEAALEKVRNKTMAMRNSQDIGDTVSTMFDELVKLGAETIRCGILIIDASKHMEVWTASSDPNGKVSLLIGSIDMMIHPLLQGAHEAWINKKPIFSYELVGEDLKEYYKAIISSPDYLLKYKIESLPNKQINTDFFFPEGALFAFTTEPLLSL